MEYVTLNNGVQMPMVGYGVFEIPAEQTAECVFNALETGYRLIDTAQAYYNEKEVTVFSVPSRNLAFAERIFSSLQRFG